MSKRAASQELDHDPILARKFSHLNVTDRGDMESVQEFALSILANRNLAQYVRRVSLVYNYWGGRAVNAMPYTATTDSELEKEAIFKAVISEQQWEEPESTEMLKRVMTAKMTSFNKGSTHDLFPDAIVALLLPILPNVQHFSVADIIWPDYIGKAIQRAKDGIFGSVSVTHLEIVANTRFSDAAWADYNFRTFEIFQNLPLLECISGKGIGGQCFEDGGSYDQIPHKASAVREIHLKDCEVSATCLSYILNFSTGLEAFTYGFGGRAGDGGLANIRTPELAKALTPHNSSMLKLDIDADRVICRRLEDEIQGWKEQLKEEENSETDESDEEGSDSETLHSSESKASDERLQEAMESEPYFPNLTRLRIGIELALRFTELSGMKTLAQWLPASLEELEIIGYTPGGLHCEQVEEVVQKRAELLPNLKILKGVEERIENGKELEDEDDYVASDASVEDASD